MIDNLVLLLVVLLQLATLFLQFYALLIYNKKRNKLTNSGNVVSFNSGKRTAESLKQRVNIVTSMGDKNG